LELFGREERERDRLAEAHLDRGRANAPGELLARALDARRLDRGEDRLDAIDPTHARDLLDEIDLAPDVGAMRPRLDGGRALGLAPRAAPEALEDAARLGPGHGLAEELIEARRAKRDRALLRLGIARVDLALDRRAVGEARRQRHRAREDRRDVAGI